MIDTQSKIGKNIFPVYARWWLYKTTGFRHQRYIDRVRKENRKFKVVFFAMNLPMWKYQELCELLMNDSRFDVTIVLSVGMPYSKEQQLEDLRALRNFFQSRQMPFVDWRLEDGAAPIDVRKELNPDILFYPQPYEYVLHPLHDFLHFYDRLLAYIPYAFAFTPDKLEYNKRFHNIAWKLYYANEYNLKDAQAIADNKGRNVVVAGYASADKFLNAPKKDVWRVQHPEMKKLIWAPHFTIRNDGSPFTLSNFLWMAEPMLQLAKTHKDSLHIAMKPHPRLKTELYEHQDWGREKTDAYYAEWEQMENTQLEVGDFADLFAGSDAMIHDCGSFLCDYLYFRKPVMFVSQHIAQAKACVNDFGKMAYDMHYIGKTIDDIHRFIEQQVMKGDDPMKEKRDGFFKAHLLPPQGKTVAQNIYQDMLNSLGFREHEGQ